MLFISLDQTHSCIRLVQKKIGLNVYMYIARFGEEMKGIRQKLREEKIRR